MSEWIVYSKDGNTERCRLKSLEYSGTWMGECSVSVTVSSPVPIVFEIGDYLYYRGERFEINYDPAVIKSSEYGMAGDGFSYENVKFNSLSDELTRCDFLDYVPNDNEIHYSSLPTFSFFADSIERLAERIQVNLDRIYTGEKKWTVSVHPEFVSVSNVNISVNNITCWDALALVKSQFNANFIIRNRTITIGTEGLVVGSLFSYGKGNGLITIERNAESDQKIITRLRAYGSTRNMPSRYYSQTSEDAVPNNMAVQHLMLPSFPSETLDPYIDSENIDELGIREGTVFFDGSGDLEEIYPSLEGMTAEELKAAGVETSATGALDEIVSAEQITDDGILEGVDNIPPFTMVVKDLGFDLNDYLGTESAVISMKDGMCGGRDFEIVSCEKQSDGSYLLTCNRSEDTGLGLYFPYSGFQIKSGDKFVLLNIEMPDAYIKAASQRLLQAATEYLSKNDYVRYSYTPTIDNIMLARQHDEAVANGLTSIHDTIKEGDFILFEDEDLGISGSITIDSLSIKEGESLIPEYSLTLKNEKTVGTIEKIQNQISSIMNGGVGGGLNAEQAKSIIEAIGSTRFLSKQKDDRSKGIIASDKGFEAGKFVQEATGAACYQDKDGNWHIETDHLKVRKKASFTEVEIETTYHVGGQQMSTGASMVVGYVLEMDSCYRCYFLKKDNSGRVTTNKWKPKDQAYCNTFNLVKQEDGTLGNHYLWRLVDATSNETADDVDVRTFGDVTINTADYHFTDLSKTVFAEGSDIPKALDEIVLLGHQGNDESRQGCIIVAGAGEGSPYIYEFKGINSFTLPEPETRIKPGDNFFTGMMRIQGGSTGASNLEDFPEEVFKAVHIGAVNLLRNSGFTGDYKSEELNSAYSLQNGSELFSRGLKHWTGSASVSDDADAVSGKCAVVGSLSQAVELIKGESYVVSFRGKGASVKVMLGGALEESVLSASYEKYSFKFVSDGVCTFSISGDATICDLQLERGTIATDWKPSPYDNDKTLAEFQALKYLQDAIVEGDTTILGGLILSSIIKLGNFKDGKMQKVNAGVSGIYNDDDDVAFWGGGTLEQAIHTVIKFKENPNYTPTDAEWANLANFVVSHGGDIYLKGSIFADNGYFRGSVIIDGGKTLLKKDGSGQLANGVVSWNKYGVMYRKSHDNIKWVSIYDFESTRQIQLEKGTYLDLTYILSSDTFTLPDAEYDGTLLSLRWEQISRSNDCAILSGNFRIRQVTSEGVAYKPISKLTLSVENKEIQLAYSSEDSAWVYRGEGASIEEDVAVIGRTIETSTEINAEVVTANKFVAGDSEGVSTTIYLNDNRGTHHLTFKGGILTYYSAAIEE